MKTPFNTKIGIPANDRKTLVALLNQTLADVSDLYSQTKQAHWNVRGKNFIALHELFDDLAEKVFGQIDVIAERITALGGLANGTVRQAAAASALPEFPTEKVNEFGYVAALAERFAKCANAVRTGIDTADEAGDPGTADLLTALSRELDQSIWFLEAHLR